ncbi:MAG: ATP-binding protein [Puniceicoccales bacterium]|jgi:hypothetical protein|nr:ATP-binding protein [Puniceicoccales bacterium]
MKATDPGIVNAAIISEELDHLIARVERHQHNLGLNDTKFVARYSRHLKTVDSWSRTLKRRDAERLTKNNIPKWTETLRKLVAEIDGASEMEVVYESLPILRCAEQLYERLQGANNDRRVAWLIGPTGIGKSMSMRYLKRHNPRDTAYTKVTPLWKDNKRSIARGLATAIGTTTEHGSSATLDHVIEHLKGAPLTLLLDEVHEGGVLLFKIIKTLVDETPVRVMLSTWPTSYRRLVNGSSEALSEAQQLLGRSLRPIYMQWAQGVREEDIIAFLKVATPEINDEQRPLLAKHVALPVKKLGLRLLADVIEAARALADAKDANLTHETIKTVFEEMAAEI